MSRCAQCQTFTPKGIAKCKRCEEGAVRKRCPYCHTFIGDQEIQCQRCGDTANRIGALIDENTRLRQKLQMDSGASFTVDETTASVIAERAKLAAEVRSAKSNLDEAYSQCSALRSDVFELTSRARTLEERLDNANAQHGETIKVLMAQVREAKADLSIERAAAKVNRAELDDKARSLDYADRELEDCTRTIEGFKAMISANKDAEEKMGLDLQRTRRCLYFWFCTTVATGATWLFCVLHGWTR